MAENDIYNSKDKYERFINNLDSLTIKPNKKGKRKYYCRNKNNLVYFNKLDTLFSVKDTSYVRRIRLMESVKVIVNYTEKNLKDLDREDINKIVSKINGDFSPKTRVDFIRDLKYLWGNLFPENDERGRIDETIMPYVVRHLSARQDKSREKRRKDKLTFEEYERIINYFNSDSRMQSYLTLALESLGRPQEMLYIRLRDIEKYDNYSKLWISEHGKEGTGFLQCIDSYPYLAKWLSEHPKPNGEDSFLFINLRGNNFSKQLTPANINKKLKLACKHLGINKPITAYSLKRNGVTFKRIMGCSDIEIQRTARWSSTKQLRTYDLTDQDDAFKIALVKKGIIKDNKFKQHEPKLETKECSFCKIKNGFNDEFCINCKRPLDREILAKQFKEKEFQYNELKKDIENLKKANETEEQTTRISTEFFKQRPKLLEEMRMLIEEKVKQEKTVA